jgi:hypothetical protein
MTLEAPWATVVPEHNPVAAHERILVTTDGNRND